jgi:hypothetical protein
MCEQRKLFRRSVEESSIPRAFKVSKTVYAFSSSPTVMRMNRSCRSMVSVTS